MKINLVIMKPAAKAKQISAEKKPYYLLVADENHPQFIYFPQNGVAQHFPFNQHDFNRFKLATGLDHHINTFMTSERLSGTMVLSNAQKEIIEQITGHIAVDLCQDNLIKRINYYLKINKYDLQLDERGVCQGLAAMYCKYVSQNNEKKFFELLEQIATTKDYEYKAAELELNTFIQETVFSFNPGVFNKNLEQSYSLENIKVQNPDKSNLMSQNARLKKLFQFNADTTNGQWEAILQAIKFEGAAYLIGIPEHAISMSYKENKFYLYDPNYSEGVKVFSSEQAVLKEIATIIIKINIAHAREDEGGKITLPILGGKVKVKYDNEQYYLYEDPIHPVKYKDYADEESLIKYISDHFIESKKVMQDMSIVVAENPYNPVHHEFPDKRTLLQTLRESGTEFDEMETILTAIVENDAELADEFLDNLTDPHNKHISSFFLLAFAKNSSEWLKKILDHPKILLHEKNKENLINQLVQSSKHLGNDKNLKILLEHPAFVGILNTDQKLLLLQHALPLKNIAAVKVILQQCSTEELKTIVSDGLIYYASMEGKEDALQLLLNIKPMDEELAVSCLFAALMRSDFKRTEYLIHKYPEYKLASTLRTLSFNENKKIDLLSQAIATGNESYVKLIISMCPHNEIEKVITSTAVYEAVQKGSVKVLDVLLSKKEVNSYVAGQCLSEAVFTNNLQMINYLVGRFPQHKLAQSFNISYALIKEYKINPETLLLLKEKGSAYAKSTVNQFQFSAADAELTLKIYAYSAKQTPENLAAFRIKKTSPANTIDFIVEMMDDKKLDEALFLQNTLLNNNALLGVELIKEFAAQGALYASRCEGIQNFVLTLIEQKNNAALSALLSIEPPVPLDYQALYEKATMVRESYKKQGWFMQTYSTKPDKQILLKLKELVEQSSAEMDLLSMLKMKEKELGHDIKLKNVDEPAPPDNDNKEASILVENPKKKASLLDASAVEPSAEVENEEASSFTKRI